MKIDLCFNENQMPKLGVKILLILGGNNNFARLYDNSLFGN
jgi:hypothetical protein